MNKVLFVEDDPDQIMLCDFKFKKEAIDMKSATSVKEAFDAVREEKPDIILLDLLLRNENGLDFLERLKGEVDYKNIPVIVFSNFDNQECRERSESLGALDYIIKSQTYPKEMAQIVKQYFQTGKYQKIEESK
jgi:CheY-like chemotaxis protein